MEQKEQLGGFCLKGHYTSQLSLTARKEHCRNTFLCSQRKREMMLYSNNSWRSNSILILLLGLSIVAAADSAGKTSPVEDGTLFTNIISSLFLVLFLGGIAHSVNGLTKAWFFLLLWLFDFGNLTHSLCSLCSKNRGFTMACCT